MREHTRTLRQIKKWIPGWVYRAYHFTLALLATIRYRSPSKHMLVIGVTGTKGKTSTVTYLQQVLNASGRKTASLSTAEKRIGDVVKKNTKHLTMGGRGYVQKRLREFVASGCEIAIIETSSEGIRQFRHWGIQYDSLVFTNLAEEHLATHKTMENYRNAKLRLFLDNRHRGIKRINGKAIQRLFLINNDDEHAHYFLQASQADNVRVATFGTAPDADYTIDVVGGGERNTFSLDGDTYTAPIPGLFTIYNLVPAILYAKTYTDLDRTGIQRAIDAVQLPGRMELIDAGQDFAVYCDYAHEPLSIASVCQALRSEVGQGGKLILSVGTVGGGRWKYNAKKIGETATRHADFTVMTTADPFFDDPAEMMREMQSGAVGQEGVTYATELDRRRAIRNALSRAQKGDVIIIAGKGAEVTYENNGVSEPWDERDIIRKILIEILAERKQN